MHVNQTRSTPSVPVPSRTVLALVSGHLASSASAFFDDDNADAVISTLDACRNPDGSGYDDVTVGEHLARK